MTPILTQKITKFETPGAVGKKMQKKIKKS